MNAADRFTVERIDQVKENLILRRVTHPDQPNSRPSPASS